MARRGPGTIEDRVQKLVNSLSAEEVNKAQELVATNPDDVLKLATYLKSQTRRQTVRDQQVAKHTAALNELEN